MLIRVCVCVCVYVIFAQGIRIFWSQGIPKPLIASKWYNQPALLWLMHVMWAIYIRKGGVISRGFVFSFNVVLLQRRRKYIFCAMYNDYLYYTCTLEHLSLNFLQRTAYIMINFPVMNENLKISNHYWKKKSIKMTTYLFKYLIILISD